MTSEDKENDKKFQRICAILFHSVFELFINMLPTMYSKSEFAERKL